MLLLLEQEVLQTLQTFSTCPELRKSREIVPIVRETVPISL